jgi:hypothetical protein
VGRSLNVECRDEEASRDGVELDAPGALLRFDSQEGVHV